MGMDVECFLWECRWEWGWEYPTAPNGAVGPNWEHWDGHWEHPEGFGGSSTGQIGGVSGCYGVSMGSDGYLWVLWVPMFRWIPMGAVGVYGF